MAGFLEIPESDAGPELQVVYADWEGHMLDLNAGDQFKPEYIKLNPKAVVPTLVHAGRVVC